jgi:enamine deaminase RidA (YjgF/YER057c/UK114 family)
MILIAMSQIEILNPKTMARPAGTYSHVARVAPGATLVVIAGQVASDASGEPAGIGDFDAQCAQAYANIGTALEAAGGGWTDVIQTMTFITRREDGPRLRAFREREFPRLFPDGRYPPNTLLIVSGLASEDWLLEVQAIAAV